MFYKNVIGSKPLLLLILLVLTLLPLNTSAQFNDHARVDDPTTFGDVADLKLAEVYDNGSMLIIHLEWSKKLPNTSSSLVITHEVEIMIDVDSNPATGYFVLRPYGFPMGVDKDIYVTVNSLDNVSVSPRDFYLGDNDVVYNDTGFYVMLSLDWLGVSEGDILRVSIPYMATIVSDRLSSNTTFIWPSYVSEVDNVTVNYTAVTVDGDIGEWDPSNSTLIVDDNDTYTLSYPGVNITRILVASDDSYLYFYFKLSSLPNESYFMQNPGDYADSLYPISGPLSYIITVNAGSGDYRIYFKNTSVCIRDPSDRWNCYPYQKAWGSNGLETAVNLSYMGLEGIVGTNISVKISEYRTRIYDNLTELGHEYGFVYQIGNGGLHVTVNELRSTRFGWEGQCVNNTSLRQLNLSITSYETLSTVYIGSFNESPVLYGTYRQKFSPIYKIMLKDTRGIIWPLHASIAYNESAVLEAGISEEDLRIYYYNETSGRMEELQDYILDPEDNMIYFNISEAVYGAGDPVILLGPIPPAVGGELQLYRTTSTGNQYNEFIPAIMMSTLAAVVLVVAMASRRKE